jgi:hypothetical protein
MIMKDPRCLNRARGRDTHDTLHFFAGTKHAAPHRMSPKPANVIEVDFGGSNHRQGSAEGISMDHQALRGDAKAVAAAESVKRRKKRRMFTGWGSKHDEAKPGPCGE